MHAYDITGAPRHTVVGKNGQPRPTSIADLRKHGWFPSATTVLNILPKDFLVAWKLKELAKQAWAQPPHDGEVFEDWFSWLNMKTEESQQHTLDLGTAIHKAMEDALSGRAWDTTYAASVNPALELIHDNGWVPVEIESVVISPSWRCGGTVDLVFVDKEERLQILDFKTKKTERGRQIKPYQQYPMQLAAYHVMKWGMIKEGDCCHNLFISSTEEGRIHLETYKEKEMQESWEGFRRTLELYEWLNNLGAK